MARQNKTGHGIETPCPVHDKTYSGSNRAVKCLSSSGAYVNLKPFNFAARFLIAAKVSAT